MREQGKANSIRGRQEHAWCRLCLGVPVLEEARYPLGDHQNELCPCPNGTGAVTSSKVVAVSTVRFISKREAFRAFLLPPMFSNPSFPRTLQFQVLFFFCLAGWWWWQWFFPHLIRCERILESKSFHSSFCELIYWRNMAGVAEEEAGRLLLEPRNIWHMVMNGMSISGSRHLSPSISDSWHLSPSHLSRENMKSFTGRKQLEIRNGEEVQLIWMFKGKGDARGFQQHAVVTGDNAVFLPVASM